MDTSGGAFRVSRPRKLFSGQFADLTSANNMYDVAPDGKRFVMFQGEIDQTTAGHEHLHVISDWFVELERTFAK